MKHADSHSLTRLTPLLEQVRQRMPTGSKPIARYSLPIG